MAEPLRKDEGLTTADLVGRNPKPELVREDRVKREQGNYADSWDPAAGKRDTNIDQPSPLFAETEIGNYRSRRATSRPVLLTNHATPWRKPIAWSRSS